MDLNKWLPKIPVGLSWQTALLILTLILVGGCGDPQEQRRSALHHFNKGNEAFVAEDYSRAIRHFETAVELDHQSPDLQYNLGLAFYVTGNHNAAVLAFQDALELNPAMADAHYNLALAYDKLYNSAAAHSHYNAYRNMIAGRNLTSAKSRKDPLPPPPNAANGLGPGGERRQRAATSALGKGRGGGLAAQSAMGTQPGQMALQPGNATNNQVLRAGRGGRPVTPVTGMPRGVRQQLPMASSSQQTAQSVRSTQTNQIKTKSEEPLLGGEQKWWIQDQFDPKW